ncbi:acyltransferase [Hymenobacter algoricola]|uniref:Acyltransferase n=1 Tax=Hymenobacter algoricola TaxID=486267 RepID=A0ABP7NSG0_9BACT
MPPPTSYFPALTGVRAVAAYLVFFHHFNPFPAEGSTRLLHNICRELHIGVPVFFVLSGFLITLRYANAYQWNGRWWREYLRNRVARIYPMYFLLTCLSYGWNYADTGEFSTWKWLANLTFVRGFFEALIYSGVAQGWTLTVEECFYLFAPVAFWLLTRPRVRLWPLPFILLAVGCGLVWLLGPLGWHGLFANFKFMLRFTFFGRCFEFFAGMQLAYWYQQGRLRHYGWPAALTTTGSLLTAAALAGMVWTRGGYTYGQEHPFGVMLNNVVLPGGIMTLFAGLLTEPSGLRRLLATPLLQVLGKSSYIFYLIHLGYLQSFLRKQLGFENELVSLAVEFLLLNLLAVALYYSVEKHLNSRIRRHPATRQQHLAPA